MQIDDAAIYAFDQAHGFRSEAHFSLRHAYNLSLTPPVNDHRINSRNILKDRTAGDSGSQGEEGEDASKW